MAAQATVQASGPLRAASPAPGQREGELQPASKAEHGEQGMVSAVDGSAPEQRSQVPSAGTAVSKAADEGAQDASRRLSFQVDSGVREQVDRLDDTNALVVMSAQYSARQQYISALYCLQRAVELEPRNVRAHYSMGQISALVGNFAAAEIAYMRCLEVVQEPAHHGQVLYCLGAALHSQVRGIGRAAAERSLLCSCMYLHDIW